MLADNDVKAEEIGVICLYRAQVVRVLDMLRRQFPESMAAKRQQVQRSTPLCFISCGMTFFVEPHRSIEGGVSSAGRGGGADCSHRTERRGSGRVSRRPRRQ